MENKRKADQDSAIVALPKRPKQACLLKSGHASLNPSCRTLLLSAKWVTAPSWHRSQGLRSSFVPAPFFYCSRLTVVIAFSSSCTSSSSSSSPSSSSSSSTYSSCPSSSFPLRTPFTSSSYAYTSSSSSSFSRTCSYLHFLFRVPRAPLTLTLQSCFSLDTRYKFWDYPFFMTLINTR